MKTETLIDVPTDRPSLRSRLTAFKRKHGILTHRATDYIPKDDSWLAVLPFDRDKGKTLFKIMSESCRLYDESGYCATGAGELSAVRGLCKLQGIVCDL